MRIKTLAVLAAAAVVLPAVASAETAAPKANPRLDAIFARVDLNKDGKITRAELKQYRENQFKAADTNGNGSLNSIEVAAMAKVRLAERLNTRFARLDKDKNGKLTLDEMGKRRRWVFWRIDRDGDGAVTKEELNRAAERRQPRRMAIRFNRLDDNRNGLISKAEYVDAPARLFRRFDRNDDNVVTREEAATVVAAFRERRRGYRGRRGKEGRHYRHYRHKHHDGWGSRGGHKRGWHHQRGRHHGRDF